MKVSHILLLSAVLSVAVVAFSRLGKSHTIKSSTTGPTTIYKAPDVPSRLVAPATEPTPALAASMPPQVVDELNLIRAKLEKIDSYLNSSGIMAQIRLNRLPVNEQKQAAEWIEQMNDLRSREIEIRLAAIRKQIEVGQAQ